MALYYIIMCATSLLNTVVKIDFICGWLDQWDRVFLGKKDHVKLI